MWFGETNSIIYTWILFLVLLQEDVLCVEIISLDIPSHVPLGQSAILKCKYELGKDELYSVKWYKGKYEFYRYVPKDTPPGQVFKLKGVKVNQTASNNYQVVLLNVGIAASGKYRCEVSAEAPSFHSVSKTKELLVVDPPDEGPTISGGQSKYKIGDPLHVNCSTIRSSPAATLEWYINGEKVEDNSLRVYPSIKDPDGLESSTLGLEFQVQDLHISNGGLHLRCVANVYPFFSLISEHSTNSGHQVASILESKGIYNQVLINSSPKMLIKLHHCSLAAVIFSSLPFLMKNSYT